MIDKWFHKPEVHSTQTYRQVTLYGLLYEGKLLRYDPDPEGGITLSEQGNFVFTTDSKKLAETISTNGDTEGYWLNTVRGAVVVQLIATPEEVTEDAETLG